MPICLVEAHIAALPRIEALDVLAMTRAHALGGGNMERAAADSLARELEATANGSTRPAVPRYASPAEVARGMRAQGFGVSVKPKASADG